MSYIPSISTYRCVMGHVDIVLLQISLITVKDH